MLCYDMQWNVFVMLCDVMVCYVMICYVMFMLCYVMLMLCDVMWCYVMLHYRCVPKIGFGAAKYRCVPKNGFWDAKYRCVPKIGFGVSKYRCVPKIGSGGKIDMLKNAFLNTLLHLLFKLQFYTLQDIVVYLKKGSGKTTNARNCKFNNKPNCGP